MVLSPKGILAFFKAAFHGELASQCRSTTFSVSAGRLTSRKTRLTCKGRPGRTAKCWELLRQKRLYYHLFSRFHLVPSVRTGLDVMFLLQNARQSTRHIRKNTNEKRLWKLFRSFTHHPVGIKKESKRHQQDRKTQETEVTSPKFSRLSALHLTATDKGFSRLFSEEVGCPNGYRQVTSVVFATR